MKRLHAILVLATIFVAASASSSQICRDSLKHSLKLGLMDLQSLNSPTVESLVSMLATEGILINRVLFDWVKRLETGEEL